MPRFMRRSTTIEAIHYDGSASARIDLAVFAGHWVSVDSSIVYVTSQDRAKAQPIEVGDWLIKIGPGYFRRCKPFVFETLYREVKE